MTAEEKTHTPRRLYALMTGFIIQTISGVAAVWGYVHSYTLFGQVAPVPWWFWPAVIVAAASTIHNWYTVVGKLHAPTKTEEEIIQEVTENGE